MRNVVLLLTLVGTSGCLSGGDPLVGFAETERNGGPLIVWDLDAEPLPDIPLPNDIATRTDATSPTGLRLNASLEATTRLERELRRNLARLDGFGTFSRIWLSFESPEPDEPDLARLDLEAITAVHRGDADFDDDLVFLIDVTKDSPTYSEAQVLDFGNGAFPLLMHRRGELFANDPRPGATNLLLETYDEDPDRDGIFEDTDGDGTLDRPNLWGEFLGDPSRMDPVRDLISFYEMETDTLLFKPIVPLREQTTYAVVVTKGLVSLAGKPIESPFDHVHHLQQTRTLAPLFEDGLLDRYGLTGDDVAFAWTFTTQSVTRDLVAIREGFHGIGSFAWLADHYPPEVERIVPVRDEVGGGAYRLDPMEALVAADEAIEYLGFGSFDTSRIQPILDTYGAVDYVVAGDYLSPDFVAAGGGLFDVDATAGTGLHTPASLRFVMVVPKPQFGPPPFPVALYCHGYGTFKLEGLVWAGVLAKYGIATFMIDAYSHGLPIGPEYDELVTVLLEDWGVESLEPLFEAVRKDRARDLNGDGFPNSGGDFFSADLFHTRDVLRQTVVDYLRAVPVLKGFDGERRWPFDIDDDGVANDLAGDFNGDGIVDVGGPSVPTYVLGFSMGGITSSLIAAVEPAVVAAAPISGGGGLLDLASRTGLTSVRVAALLPILGPMVITQPHPARPALTQLSWLVNDVFKARKVFIATIGRTDENGDVVDEMREGDVLVVTNLDNGTADEVVVNSERRVRAHLPADIGDRVEIEIWRPDGTLLQRITTFEREVENGFQRREYEAGDRLVAIQEGLGYRRNTPGLRRLLGIAQTVLEPGDPINYAPHYRDPLRIRPEGPRPTNVLITLTLGDTTVPMASGVALARAAGLIDYRNIDPAYGTTPQQLLVETGVIEAADELLYFRDSCCHAHCGSVNFDIDDLSRGQHPDDLPRLDTIVRDKVCEDHVPPSCEKVSCEPRPPLRATTTSDSGVSGARFVVFNPQGSHGFDMPNPELAFDPAPFMLNQVGLFLSSQGTVLSDHPCLADNDCQSCEGDDCPQIPPPTFIEVTLGGE